MNRNDFQKIAELRLRESRALLAAGFMFLYPLKESVLEKISVELAAFRSTGKKAE